jgi:hypothetical protein
MSKRGRGDSARGPYGAGAAFPIMLHMISTATPARRVVLVPAEPRTGRGDGAVRRYRLARVRLEGRELPRAERRRISGASA